MELEQTTSRGLTSKHDQQLIATYIL